MGSEQSSLPPKKPVQRAPPVRRGHTIAVANVPEACRSSDPTASGNNSPGASVCSDSELPYISYTVDRPIGDSPKTSSKNQRSNDKKSLLQRRQLSLQARKSKRGRDIVVVKQATGDQLDEDIQRLQEIPTFLPIMRGTLGLPGARDPEVLEGLDYRPWVRLTTRLQAHLAACAHPLAADQIGLASKVKEADTEISKLYSQMVEKQRANARHAERLSRVHEVGNQLSRCGSLLNQLHIKCHVFIPYGVDRVKAARHAERLSRVHEVGNQLSRCGSLLNQTLQDIEELNSMLPVEKQLEPFVWNDER